MTEVQLKRRKLLQGCALLIPVLITPRLACAQSIIAVRTWPSDEYTRITLEMDQALKADHFILEGPHRLVLDITGAKMSPAIQSLLSQIKIDDPYVRTVRAAQNTPTVLRLVIELKQPVAPQVFTLRPISPYAHRLVVDLYSFEPKDPLTAFIADMDDDPLGSVIAQIDSRTPSPPPPSSTAPERKQPFIIALDPGHGGEDPGAVGRSGTREKDVVLAIAHRLRAMINTTPGMRAFMTRDGDYFVPLHVRVQKARRVKADLFISIHADAWIKPSARGGSVFVLSEKGASSSMARTLARQQNASDLIGGVKISTQDKHLARLLLDLSTSAQIRDSNQLGSKVLTRIGQVGRLHKPRVESAGFAVLKAPDIPSILVETAFISNPQEEALLRDPGHQQKLAAAIMAGINDYIGAGRLTAAR